MQPDNPQAPAAPAAPVSTEPVAPAAPAAPVAPPEPAAPVAPVARTQDPVDHSAPVAPDAPVADPAAQPEGTPPAPDGEVPPADDAAPTAATLADDVEEDDLEKQIQEAAAKSPDGQLPSGVNADGTINPLVYAYESLPEIKVQGKEGDTGEVKEYVVKTVEDLPEGFQFANGIEQAKFSAAVGQNMAAATDLINEANAHNTARIAQNERREMLVSQKNEVESLIASGKLPAMALKPTDPNFMQDPGAVRAQQVLDHMKEVNTANKAAGINQEITSVALGLQLLEAKEAIEGKNARMGTIVDTRNDVNSKISGGGSAPAQGDGNKQRVYKNVNEALKAARKREGI